MTLTWYNKLFGKITSWRLKPVESPRNGLNKDFPHFEYFHSLFDGYKGLELNIYWSDNWWHLFHSSLSLSVKGDHPGFSINLEMWKFDFELKIYDGRHWNWDANRFYKPGEETYGEATWDKDEQ